MKIGKVNSTSSPTAARRKKRVAGGDGAFADHLARAAGVENEPEIQEMAPVGGVDAVLAAQTVYDDSEAAARRNLVRRGEDILDRLEEIRRDILLGALSRERLVNLAASLRARRTIVSDPELLTLIDEIELRAEVEVAKFSRGG